MDPNSDFAAGIRAIVFRRSPSMTAVAVVEMKCQVIECSSRMKIPLLSRIALLSSRSFLRGPGVAMTTQHSDRPPLALGPPVFGSADDMVKLIDAVRSGRPLRNGERPSDKAAALTGIEND